MEIPNVWALLLELDQVIQNSKIYGTIWKMKI